MFPLAHHYAFLQRLQISFICFLSLLLILYLVLHGLGLYEYLIRRSRWKRDDIVVKIDEQQGGDARYLLTVATTRDYSHATTATTTVHLLGNVFPGRIHDIHKCKLSEKLHIFAPKCHEKVVVREDISLDPVIGLVLKTNHIGTHPTWNCRTVIVRNLETNDAWFFKIKEEINHARCFSPVESEFLVSLNYTFTRRLRHEWKHGQHAIFGLYFWDPSSAFHIYQRIAVMVVTHIALLCFTLMGLCLSFPSPGQTIASRNSQMSRMEKGYTHAGIKQYGWSLEGETVASIWFSKIFPSALLAGFITTILTFVMNFHFRHREKYETGLSEMDYVICTALRDISTKKREHRLKRKSTRGKRQSAGDGNNKEQQQHHSSSMDMTPEAKLSIVPHSILSRLSPREARDIQRQMFIGGKYLKEPEYQQYLSSAQPLPEHQPDMNKAVNAFKRSPAVPESEDHATSRLAAIVMTNLAAKRSRRLISQKLGNRSRTSGGGDLSMSKSYSGSDLKLGKPTISLPELRSPNYSVDAGNRNYTEDTELLPGEPDPAKLRRSTLQPASAWVITFGVLLLAMGGIFFFGVTGPAATMHITLFILLLLTEYIVALLILSFFFEIVKTCLVSLYYAYHDWKLYQLILEGALLPKDIGFQYKF